MKNIVKRLIRNERGQAMLLAVILLLVGGLIVASLLSFMGTGLLVNPVYEGRVAELYGADAGVEDAVWNIQRGYVKLCPGDPDWPPYYITVNNKTVEVNISSFYGVGNVTTTYRVVSTATGDGSGTKIEAYLDVLYMDFSSLLDNAIVSYDTIDIQPNSLVNGDVWLPDEDNLEIHNPADITGEVKDEEDVELIWPTAGQLSSYYLDDVNPSNPYPYDSIDVKDTKNIGPCYIDGDFVVDNTGDPDTLILNGTVYVAGDLDFRQSGSHGYTVDLNGHTIFAEGSIEFPSNAVTISGSGCIIAVGYINFQPSIVSGEDDFVLVMSITDRVDFQPSGEFTGCVAGNTEVQLQPGCTINWIDPEAKDLNFPGASDGDELPPVAVVSIKSWEVNQLVQEDLGE